MGEFHSVGLVIAILPKKKVQLRLLEIHPFFLQLEEHTFNLCTKFSRKRVELSNISLSVL